MPAIQLERLRGQVAQVGDLFLQPAELVRRLQDLFEFYADRTRRSGQVGSRVPLLPHQNIPLPVLRELNQELRKRAGQVTTADVLRAADALWAAGSYEMRLLSAGLLSAAAGSPAEISSRLESWSAQTREKAIIATLLESGHAALERNSPGAWLGLTRRWLEDGRPEVKAAGLEAAGLMIQETGYENYPMIFSLLAPLFQSPPPTLQSSLASLIRILAERSPNETIVFLRHALVTSPDRSITRLVRRCLPLFEARDQQMLREALAARLAYD